MSDAVLDPDALAAWAAAQPPGPGVADVLAMLNATELSQQGQLDYLAASERLLGWVQGRQHRVLAALAASEPRERLECPDRRWVVEEVACLLRLASPNATARLALAEALARRPATLHALERGALSVIQAHTLAHTLQAVAEPLAVRVEARVLPAAAGQAAGQFRRALTRALQALAPKQAEQQHDQEVAARRVVCRAAEHGMSELWAYLPAGDAAAVMTAVQALADRVTPDDPRTADQRRADALTHLATTALTGQACGQLPRQQRARPSVQVTVALSTLLNLDEQPGELTGHGPIPAALARRLAADPTGTWRRLVTDHLGHLIDYGRTTYRPPKELTEHVTTRDRTCRFPHCTRTATRSELDHIQAWADGGATTAANLHALCPRHHHLKHETPWTVRRTPDGHTHWTSPTGRNYRTPAATHPIDTTTTADPHPPPPF